MNNDRIEELLKTEVEKNIGNVSMNFKFFEFKVSAFEKKMVLIKFSFPKYRSFEANATTLFYKNMSRIVKL